MRMGARDKSRDFLFHITTRIWVPVAATLSHDGTLAGHGCWKGYMRSLRFWSALCGPKLHCFGSVHVPCG